MITRQAITDYFKGKKAIYYVNISETMNPIGTINIDLKGFWYITKKERKHIQREKPTGIVFNITIYDPILSKKIQNIKI